MKILIVTANFATEGINPWLLDDLAESFVTLGHEVDVLVHSPTAPRPRGPRLSTVPGLRTWSVGATRKAHGSLGKLISYAVTGLRLHTSGWRFVKRQKYDLCIYTSIATTSYGFPSRVRRAGIAKSLLFVMWDFFPIHNIEIGRIPSTPLDGFLKATELQAIRRADVVATMSPANEAFMRSYHPAITAPIVHIPPWAAPQQISSGGEKRPIFTAVFGGQLAPGRGVDTLLDAAHELEAKGLAIEILIAGDGTERLVFEARAHELKLRNVTFLGSLPREQYRSLLSTAHVGIAITVEGVTPPSFPSKIVEYCMNGLPVVVCLEASSDAGSIIESHGAGVTAPAGDAHLLAEALRNFAAEHATGQLALRGEVALQLFHDELSVTRAAQRMIASTTTKAIVGNHGDGR